MRTIPNAQAKSQFLNVSLCTGLFCGNTQQEDAPVEAGKYSCFSMM